MVLLPVDFVFCRHYLSGLPGHGEAKRHSFPSHARSNSNLGRSKHGATTTKTCACNRSTCPSRDPNCTPSSPEKWNLRLGRVGDRTSWVDSGTFRGKSRIVSIGIWERQWESVRDKFFGKFPQLAVARRTTVAANHETAGSTMGSNLCTSRLVGRKIATSRRQRECICFGH